MVKDTKFTFEIVTKNDVLKSIPKEHTVFRFEVPFDSTPAGREAAPDQASDKLMQGTNEETTKPLVFEIHGSQFEVRAPDRTNKKFRWHVDKDL